MKKQEQHMTHSQTSRKLLLKTMIFSQPLKLNFKPNESLLVEVNDKGEAEIIDLGFTAKKIE